MPRDELWEALNDPAVLVRTIPGCLRLEEISPDAYRMTIYAGASHRSRAPIRVRCGSPTSINRIRSCSMQAGPARAPSTPTCRCTCPDQGSTTRIDYDADVVGGMIGGVGQRVLGGVAKTAGEFFSSKAW